MLQQQACPIVTRNEQGVGNTAPRQNAASELVRVKQDHQAASETPMTFVIDFENYEKIRSAFKSFI